MSLEAWGDDDADFRGPDGYVTDEQAAEMVKEATQEMEHDILVLMLRLYGEDKESFAPETLEVFNRWKPRIDAKLGGPSVGGSSA